MERHHVIPKARLRTAWRTAKRAGEGPLAGVGITALLADERNLCDLCNRHHHRVTHGFDKLALSMMPRGIFDFARDYAIEWMLHRELRAFQRR